MVNIFLLGILRGCPKALQNTLLMSTNLVMSKSIAARMKATINSKLELLDAVMGLRLARKLVNVFQISMDVVTFWCDSMIALCWIWARSIKFKQCVANRVSEIQSTTNLMMWKHVPAKINRADLVSKDAIVGLLTSEETSALEWTFVLTKTF